MLILWEEEEEEKRNTKMGKKHVLVWENQKSKKYFFLSFPWYSYEGKKRFKMGHDYIPGNLVNPEGC